MRLLVFGQSGQVAQELARRLPQGVSAQFLSRDQADLSDPAACAAAIGGCDAVINAAAYTAVDKAEADEAAALVVNATAPTAIAARCAALDIPFLHLSTDYVFDGAGPLPFATVHPAVPKRFPTPWRASKGCHHASLSRYQRTVLRRPSSKVTEGCHPNSALIRDGSIA